MALLDLPPFSPPLSYHSLSIPPTPLQARVRLAALPS